MDPEDFSVSQVNLIPIANSAIGLVTVLGLEKLSDVLQVKVPILIFDTIVPLVASIILACWPPSTGAKFFGYFLLSAKGATTPILVSCLPIIWPTDPDSRAVVIGITISMVYAHNAWIPLYVWPVSQAPHFKYGFKVAAGFAAGSLVFVILLHFLVLRKIYKKNEATDKSKHSLHESP